MSVSDYFNVFPSQDDETFTMAVTRKQEFRELSNYGFTQGLYNNQELVVRIMKPGTGIHAIFLDSYMGTGKTRTGLTIIENWRGIMKNLPILLSPGDTIEAVHRQEIKAMQGELSTTEINKKYDIRHYSEFTNNITSLMSAPNGETLVREKYGYSVIFADEIHNLRSAKQDKRTFQIFQSFLHLVMDISIIVLATGTSMVDNASEINLLNLILPMNKQMQSSETIKRTSTADSGLKLRKYFKPYFSGYVMYFNQDPTTVPPVELLGDIHVLSDGLKSKSPIVKHGMSEYQNSVYLLELSRIQMQNASIVEEDEEEYVVDEDMMDEVGVKASKIPSRVRYALNFVFPDEPRGSYINFDKHAVTYLGEVRASSIGHFKDPSFVEKMSNMEQLKEHSAKFGDIIEDILNTPTIVRYVYTPWVRMGVVIFGILLELYGFSYYSGNTEINPTTSSKRKRYAVISQGAKKSQMQNIIRASNMLENKYGEYLQVIVGSPRSGEGVSLTNARHVDITQADWHKSGMDQVTARVIRLSSLNFFDKNNKDEYKISVAMHASVSIPTEEDTGDDFTKDIELFYLSDLKDTQISFVRENEEEFSINTALSSYRNKNKINSQYAKIGSEIAIDYTTFLNQGYGEEMKENAIYAIKEYFISKYTLNEEDVGREFPLFPSIAIRMGINTLIQNNSILMNRWGKESFIKYDNGIYYLQYGTLNEVPNMNQTIYHTKTVTTIFDFIRKSLLDEFYAFVDANEKLSNPAFAQEYLNRNIEFKIVSLEAILVDKSQIPERIRNNILQVMRNNWFLLPERDCIVHVLEHINIDRVHYSANVSKLQSNGKIRIYCYNDEIPHWRFTTEMEEPFVLEYVNAARIENEEQYSRKATVYGILNTTDNLFRIKDTNTKEGAEANEGKKKPKGFICVDSKKDIVIKYLHMFNIQPPEQLVQKYGKTKTSAITKKLKRSGIIPSGSTISPPFDNEANLRFYYIWLQASMTIEICPSLKNYFANNKLLFVK